jgi:hypothetical protein
MNPNKKTPKKPQDYLCYFCDFKCYKKGDYNKHILTNKHKNLTNPNKKTPDHAIKLYTCKWCDKNYKHMSTLSAHKKKCISKIHCENNDEFLEENGYIDGINIQDKDALLLHLLKQNGELQKSLIALSKEKTITNNNNNTISHNKTFNLNLFLNETCKDALNIQDFVSSIKVSLDDLENTGRKGYIEGVSNIILKNLKNLGQYERPIHCSDQKREVLYIKDDNQWIKESEEKPILTKAIKSIANENMKKIKEWKDLNPDCINYDSQKNNLYLKIVSNSMNGISEDESKKNLERIISCVAKETIIEKLPVL